MVLLFGRPEPPVRHGSYRQPFQVCSYVRRIWRKGIPQESEDGGRTDPPPVAPPWREAISSRRRSGSGRAATPLRERFGGVHPQAGESGRNTLPSRGRFRTASRFSPQPANKRDWLPGSFLPSHSQYACFSLYIRRSTLGPRFGALENGARIPLGQHEGIDLRGGWRYRFTRPRVVRVPLECRSGTERNEAFSREPFSGRLSST